MDDAFFTITDKLACFACRQSNMKDAVVLYNSIYNTLEKTASVCDRINMLLNAQYNLGFIALKNRDILRAKDWYEKMRTI